MNRQRPAITFQASGSTSYGPNRPYTGPDGISTLINNHHTGAENGISDVRSTAMCLLGVFLDSNRPDLTPAPDTLDFGSAESRDFTSLSPALKQVFFIGDGYTSTGVLQQVMAPMGAARLFLGLKDGEGWYNNLGSLSVQVDVVPEPTIIVLAVAFAVGMIARGRLRRECFSQ